MLTSNERTRSLRKQDRTWLFCWLRSTGAMQGSTDSWEGSPNQSLYWSTSSDDAHTWSPHQVLVAPRPPGLPVWGPVLHNQVCPNSHMQSRNWKRSQDFSNATLPSCMWCLPANVFSATPGGLLSIMLADLPTSALFPEITNLSSCLIRLLSRHDI